MPGVTTSFTIRHLDYLDPTIRAEATGFINSHLTVCGKHEPQPELWHEMLNALSGNGSPDNILWKTWMKFWIV